jgi:ferredoxin
MRVSANSTSCVVSSLCVYRVPEVFDQDEEGHVIVVDANPPAGLHEAVRRAARGCPTKSICVDDDQ